MKYYDVIIIGAGIAGCGLAHNLKKIGYKGSVLIIDKKGVGSNAAYGYRVLFKKILDLYNLPYKHRYKGIKVGVNDEVSFVINKEAFLCDYRVICNCLLKRSDATFSREQALNLSDNKLLTNKSKYFFKYLVDCSGVDFFIKKRLSQNLPMRYWVGHVKKLVSKERINDDYLFYMFDDSGYMEDFYPMKDKIFQGDWQYVKEIDFNKINPPKKTLFNNLKNPFIEEEFFVADPVAPALPNSYQNFSFVGDSFGGGTPSAGVGIEPALYCSKILSVAIKNNNLNFFKKTWKKLYFKPYLLSLASRLDRYHDSRLLKSLKRYPKNTEALKLFKKTPELFIDLCMNNRDFKLPKEVSNLFPKRKKFFTIIYYLYLRLKYLS